MEAKISCPLNFPNCKSTCHYLKGNGGGIKLCDWPYRIDFDHEQIRYLSELLRVIEEADLDHQT